VRRFGHHNVPHAIDAGKGLGKNGRRYEGLANAGLLWSNSINPMMQ
jgi:hypothetical protein